MKLTEVAGRGRTCRRAPNPRPSPRSPRSFRPSPSAAGITRNHTESHAQRPASKVCLSRESQRRCHRCQTTSAVWGRLPAPSAPFLTRQPTNEAMAAARLGVLGAHLQPSCGTVCRSPTRRWAQLMSTGRALPRCCTRCRVRVADTKAVVPPPARWAQLNLGAPCHAAARAVACASLTLNPWCAPGSASLQGRGGR